MFLEIEYQWQSNSLWSSLLYEHLIGLFHGSIAYTFSILFSSHLPFESLADDIIYQNVVRIQMSMSQHSNTHAQQQLHWPIVLVTSRYSISIVHHHSNDMHHSLECFLHNGYNWQLIIIAFIIARGASIFTRTVKKKTKHVRVSRRSHA